MTMELSHIGYSPACQGHGRFCDEANCATKFGTAALEREADVAQPSPIPRVDPIGHRRLAALLQQLVCEHSGHDAHHPMIAPAISIPELFGATVRFIS
jgi:hypothetical protein